VGVGDHPVGPAADPDEEVEHPAWEATGEEDREPSCDHDEGEAARRRAATIGALEDYPYLVEIAARLPESGYDSGVQFAWGLDLILDGLDRLRHARVAP
jgi:hypothetical protein